VYKRYYSPFEEKPVRAALDAEIIRPQKAERTEERTEGGFEQKKKSEKTDFFSRIASDDIILMGILFLLLTEEKENRDMPLVLGVAFLLLIDYINAD
jgi:hypothetical protein